MSRTSAAGLCDACAAPWWAVLGMALAACWPGCTAQHAEREPSPADSPARAAAARPHAPAALSPDLSGGIRLRHVTDRTGIAFRHTDGSSGRRYILEAMSAGLATFDYDLDGNIDIYFLSGAPLPGTTVDQPPAQALYRNEGDWRFADATALAGVGDKGFGLGVTVGDYDNDGFPDLFLNNGGPKVLYHNNGDGTFTDATALAGVGGPPRIGAGACFLDMDGDGDLDLYVANYVQLDFAAHRPKYVSGLPTYPGPLDHPPEAHQLYRNNGGGTFTDASVEAGLAGRAATGMGMICCDYDNDGDTDIYVANDVMANWLLQNDGHGRFRDVAIPTGTAFDAAGMPQSSMGVDCADYDNDGWLDLHVTAYQNQMATLYRNLGTGFFLDVTRSSGAGQGTLRDVKWGNGFVDFDNDGWPDLFIACGHTEDNIELRDKTTSYRARNLLLRNTGQGRFTDVSDRCGDGLEVALVSRGAAFDDLDNDGRVDAVILNSRDAPTVLRNETAAGHHWLQLELKGTQSNRDGVGAHVTVVAGDLRQLREVHSGRGYQSHFGSRLHFGLGPQRSVERIEIRWIGGDAEGYNQVTADQRLLVVQGRGLFPMNGDR